MERVHLLLGYALVALNLIAGVWGVLRRETPQPGKRVDAWFVQVRALAITTIAATGIAGLLLLADGGSPEDPLHTRVYGPFMVLAFLVAAGFRADSTAIRFQRVLAVASLIVAALGLRALFTA